jgi:integrase
MSTDTRVTLRVRSRGGGPVIFARWRDEDGVQIEPSLGRGWLVNQGDPDAKPRGKSIGGWVERRGRPPDGLLTVDAAWRAVPAAIERHARQKAARQRATRTDAATGVSLAVGTERWLSARKVDDPEGRWEAWKHSHAENMTRYARRVVRELGAERDLRTFTTAELRRWLAEELKPMRNGRPLERPATRKLQATYAQTVTGMFRYALAEGWIDRDPTEALPAFRTRRKRSNDVLRREEYLMQTELRAALDELRKGETRPRPGRRRTSLERQQDAAVIMVMAMAGLRPGEAIALRWADVDFEAKVIRVVEARTMGVTDTPKSGSGRFVPMSETLAAALRGLRVREVLVGPGDRVFVGRDGAHVNLVGLAERFDAAQRRAAIAPCRDLRQMRNTFGTVMAAEGVPLRTIQQWMGHASITTTEIYASFMPRAEDAAVIDAAFT